MTNQSYYYDRKLSDVTNPVRPGFNSHFDYDFAGRLKKAKAGNDTDWTKNPYYFIYKYNEFGDTLKRTGDLNETPAGTTPGHHWSQTLPDFTATWANHRDASLQYTATGSLGTEDDYNQAGFQAKKSQTAGALQLTTRYNYSGDGEQAYVNNYYHSSPHTPPPNNPANSNENNYYLRSSVTGGVMASFSLKKNAQGTLYQCYTVGLSLGAGRIAEYSYIPAGWEFTYERRGVKWVYENPVTGARFEHSYKAQAPSAPLTVVSYEDSEADPVGGDVGISDPYLNPPSSGSDNLELDIDRTSGDIHDYRASCKVDGAPVACSEVMGRISSPGMFEHYRSVHFGPYARAIGIIGVFAGPDWRTEGRGAKAVLD